jgi:hypothetical protein
VPMAFLISTVKETSTYDVNEISNGNINFRWLVTYYHDAAAHSKTKISGTYEDSEDNSGDLDSTLKGVVDSSLTTATAVNIEGTIDIEVTKDGYILVTENPLAEAQSEEPYLVMTPYGEGVNATGLSSAWEEYGTGDLTGDVGYATTQVSSSDQIIWQGMEFCGETITDSSTSDAVKKGDEKLYTPSCLGGTRFQSVIGIMDDGAEINLPWSVNQVTVDYDLAANSTDAYIGYNSGSSPEVFADVDCVFLQASTDRCAQTLG